MGLDVVAQIIAELRVRYAAINLHYEAAWTDSWSHRRCLHAPSNSHRRGEMRDALPCRIVCVCGRKR